MPPAGVVAERCRNRLDAVACRLHLRQPLRPPMSEPEPLLLRFAEFELDEANARLKRQAQVLDVAPRAFSVLCALARRPGQLVTKDELLDAVWGHRYVTESV